MGLRAGRVPLTTIMASRRRLSVGKHQKASSQYVKFEGSIRHLIGDTKTASLNAREKSQMEGDGI